MKKFVIALIMALMSVAAFGQMTKKSGLFVDVYTFKLGDYTYTASLTDDYREVVFTKFCLVTKNDENEVEQLCDFIEKNKGAIEKKYGIVIKAVAGTSLFITIPEHREARKMRLATEAEKEAMEREKRLNSLNSLNI